MFSNEIAASSTEHGVKKLGCGQFQPVDGEPYVWPFDGEWSVADSALIIIDMQVDFCGVGGYIDTMGYDIKPMRALIPAISSLLKAAREEHMLVIHTREGHRGDLSDLPQNKLWRSRKNGAGIGDCGPCGRVLVRGESGWEIIPELSPVDREPIIDKPGKGAFFATDLELILRTARISHLIFCGVTTDVCVTTTMREANDRGFECLLVEDCCAATQQSNHDAAIAMTKMQGGIFGSVARSRTVLAAISHSPQARTSQDRQRP